MGCSNSSQTAEAFPGSRKQKPPKVDPDTLDQLRSETGAVPGHGANELPPREHESEFIATNQIAWIIDDAVPKTKPLPKKKKVLDLSEKLLLDQSTDEQPPQSELPPVNRDTTSAWVGELREMLMHDFDFVHVTESVYATVSELTQTQQIICKRIDKAAREGKKTLLFVYFRGNGGLDMRCLDTYAILQNGKAFAIEHFLRDLAKQASTYVFGLIDCPRLRLDYHIEDGYVSKDEGIKNLILMFGCRPYQDLKQPSVWALFTLMKKMRKSKTHRSICLPDDLILTVRAHRKGAARYNQDAGKKELLDEERLDYLVQMYELLDKQWGGSKRVFLNYSSLHWSGAPTPNDDDQLLQSARTEDITQHESAAKKHLLETTLAMREQLHPREIPKSEQTIDWIARKVKATVLHTMGPRAAQHLDMINIGEQESLLFWDDTYQIDVYNVVSKEVVGTLPFGSFQLKCMRVAETKLFIGLSSGEIHMYDPFTLEMLDKAMTYRNNTPVSMVLQSAGTLLVGMANGSIEIFTFQQNSLTAANHLFNEIQVPYAGEIYQIHVSTEPPHEIALATFSGLFFGSIEIAPQGRPYQVWRTAKVYLRDKMISQICEVRPRFYLIAEYSKPGYWLIDRADESLDPGKIEDTRPDHNSGCTNLELIPMYEETKFPYAISRCKFKIDLVDLADKRVHTLCKEANTSAITPKMAVQTTRQIEGHSIEVYMNCQVADRRAAKVLKIEPNVVRKMFKEPEKEYFS